MHASESHLFQPVDHMSPIVKVAHLVGRIVPIGDGTDLDHHHAIWCQAVVKGSNEFGTDIW